MRGLVNVVILVGVASAFRYRPRKVVGAARVLTPADGDEYISALSTINRFCPVRCASHIVQPSSTRELAGWMRANAGTPFTLKGGGHSYACQSVPKDGGVLIHTGKLNQATVFKREDGSSFARTGPGLSFDQVIPRLAKMNYSMPHGECLTVGLGGWNFNIGQHPELKNFDNKWGYDGKPFLTKVTFVDYDGTIFTVDKKGINLVELGNTTRLRWQAKANKAILASAAMWLGTNLTNGIQIPAVHNVMRVFQTYGASLAIATELEIELVPKSEPGFFQVTYKISDLLDDIKGKQLMQDLYEVVAQAGPDPDLDCGIFYVSHYFEGSKEGAIALKCADWVSRSGDTVKSYAPPGYAHFGAKKSGFLFWSFDSYGKGWLPNWHAEPVDVFEKSNGPELYRDHLRKLESSDNPCDSCASELMFMSKAYTTSNIMFDNLCSADLSKQTACTAYMLESKATFMGSRAKIYKQNLPSCVANPDWKNEIVEYRGGANLIAQSIKRDWDPKGVVNFWLGVGHAENGASCDAAERQDVGNTCKIHGITAETMVQAERSYVRSRCPEFDSYDTFDSQNNKCSNQLYEKAEPLPFVAL